MSNPILQSAQSSAVVATLRESDTVNPFIYNEKGRIVSPHSMSLLNTTKSAGSVGANSTCSFDISKNGILTGVFLEMTLPKVDLTDTNTRDNNLNETNSGTTTSDSSTASADTAVLTSFKTQGFLAMGLLQCIDNIVLQTSGRQIERLSRYQILARYSSLPASKKVAVQESMRFAQQPDDGDASTNYKVVMWVPFYFFRDPLRYGYNTSFCEPLRCDVTFSDCKVLQTGNLTAGALNAHAPTDTKLVCQYRQLDARDEDALVNAQYGDGLLSQCVSIMKEEAVHTFDSASSGLTKVSIDLKENPCVSAIYICVTKPDKVANTDTYAVSLQHREVPIEIENIQLTASGVTVLDCHGDLIKYFGKWGEHDSTNVSHGNGERAFENVYKIDFGTGGAGHTNTIALRELSTPHLELNVKARTASTGHEVRVMYETTTFLSTSSATGRVQLSISS